MYTVEQALEKILAAVTPSTAVRVPLLDSIGRALAEEVIADIGLPPFTNSAVDGYAARAGDTAGAGPHNPVPLTCIEDIPAGAWPQQTLGRGQCARIMTGASVPPGADAIVMVEDTRKEGKQGTGNREEILILESARAGQHIRRMGEDAQIGETMLAAGDVIGGAQIGLLAQMGRDSVLVTRPPRVAVISTGDEVVEIASGVIPARGKIRNSNSYALAAMAREAGGIIHSRRHLPDDMAATQAALRECASFASFKDRRQTTNDGTENNGEENGTEDRRWRTEGATGEDGLEGADIIITAGGVSVGDRDFVRPALESLGTLDLWRVAMKPGKPLAFGRIGRTLFFGLPGNPVSALVTFELFVRPALRKMAGVRANELARRQVTATLLAPLAHVPPRREYVRALTEWRDGRFVALPLSGQSSANMAALCRANSLVIVPEMSQGANTGDVLPVLLLE